MVVHRSRSTDALIAVVPATAIALLAAGVPLFVWQPLRDQLVLPRLAGTTLLAGLALVASAAVSKSPIWSRRIALPLGAAALIVVLSSLSTAVGVDPMGSLLGEYQRYQGLVPLLMYLLLMIATMLAVSRRAGMLIVLWGAFAGGVLAGGYAVLQRMGLDWVQWEGVDAGRTGGAFAQPDALGIELLAVLALGAGLWGESTGWRRELVALGMAVMGAGLLFTESRAAWLGASAAAIVLFAFQVRRAAWRAALTSLLPVLMVAGTFLIVLSPGRGVLRQTFDRARSSANLADVSVSARLGLWRSALEMISAHPLVGSGPDAFSTLFSRYRTPSQPGIGTANLRPESSHNFFLDQAVATGVPGLLAWALLIGSTLWTGLRALRSQPSLVAALTAGLVGYYVAVSFAFAEAMTGWLPWLMMGALMAIARASGQGVTRNPDRSVRVTALGRLILGGCGCLLMVAAGLIFFADLAAGRADAAARRGDAEAAIEHAGRAYRLNPLQGVYLLDRGANQELAAATGDERLWGAAASTYRLFNHRFAPSAYSLIAEARARAATQPQGANLREVDRLLQEAARIDPYNDAVRQAIAQLRASLGQNSLP